MQACKQRSFKINTAESAQPRNCSIVTRPFFLMRGQGLGTRLLIKRRRSIDLSWMCTLTPTYVRPGPMAHWY